MKQTKLWIKVGNNLINFFDYPRAYFKAIPISKSSKTNKRTEYNVSLKLIYWNQNKYDEKVLLSEQCLSLVAKNKVLKEYEEKIKEIEEHIESKISYKEFNVEKEKHIKFKKEKKYYGLETNSPIEKYFNQNNQNNQKELIKRTKELMYRNLSDKSLYLDLIEQSKLPKSLKQALIVTLLPLITILSLSFKIFYKRK